MYVNLSIFICGAQTIKIKILANLQFLRLCKKKKCEKNLYIKKNPICIKIDN